MKNNMNLYLIGNGFDMHHDIKSSYIDYSKWLKNYNHRIYDCFIDLFEETKTSDLWRDFECSLGQINIEEYSYRSLKYQPSISLKGLLNRIENTFLLWLLELNKPNADKKLSYINSESKYITFNYTKTLENLYSIPTSNILHIHGSLDTKDIIIGHEKNSQTLIDSFPLCNKIYCNGIKISQYDYEEAWNENFKAINSFYKDTDKILRLNQNFLNTINNAKKIYVLGTSISEPDHGYFRYFIKQYPESLWFVSYFTDKEQIYMSETLISMGLKSERLNFFKMIDGPHNKSK